MKTKSIYVILVLIICIPIVTLLFMFLGPFPHLSSGGKIIIRQGLLERWRNEVNAFAATEGRVPESLYDICKKWVQDETYLYVIDEVYLGWGGGMLKEDEKKNLSQEEYFNEKIHFILLKSKTDTSWIIKERNDSVVGQDTYFIDQSGFIFKATCLSQAPDLKKLYIIEAGKKLKGQ
jgi:hypothetical protein